MQPTNLDAPVNKILRARAHTLTGITLTISNKELILYMLNQFADKERRDCVVFNVLYI